MEQFQCVLWLEELPSLMPVQCRFRTQYGRQPPTRKSFLFWGNKVRTTGCLLRVQSRGNTRTSEENGSRIRKTFQRSPRKSIRVASLQLRTNSTFNSV
jgi:hypothetical protein